MTIVPALIGSFIVLAVIALGLWYFERMLAKRPSKYAGIGMPAAFLVLSLFSIVKSIPSVVETMLSIDPCLGEGLAPPPF